MAEPIEEVLRSGVTGGAEPDIDACWAAGRRSKRRRRIAFILTCASFILVPLAIAASGVLESDSADSASVAATRGPKLLPESGSSFIVQLLDTVSPRNQTPVRTRLTVEQETVRDGRHEQVHRLDTTQASERTTIVAEGSKATIPRWTVASGPRNEACSWSPPVDWLRLEMKPGDHWTASARCPGRLDLSGTDLAIDMTVDYIGSGTESTVDGELLDVWILERLERVTRTTNGQKGQVVSTIERHTTERFAPSLGLDVYTRTETTVTEAATSNTTSSLRELRLVSSKPLPYRTKVNQ